MKHWRIQIKPTSLQLTPWQADTIFGSLCWAFVHREGNQAVKNFLIPFIQNDPPFLISDAFPTGYLPVPLSLRVRTPGKIDDTASYAKQKLVKKVQFLTFHEFHKVSNGEWVEVSEQNGKLIKPVSQLHSTIDRIVGTTRGSEDQSEMSLYQSNGWVLNTEIVDTLSVYIAERHDKQIDKIFALLQDIEYTGFGKKKSSGMGAFRMVGNPEPVSFPDPQSSANGFVSLSGFIPSSNDPTQGFWQLRVKHGKLGEYFAAQGSPFKKPWIQLEPGSTFYTQSIPGERYGRMLTELTDIANDPGIVQYGYAYPLPVCFSSELIAKVIN